jgi:hypothetical protein
MYKTLRGLRRRHAAGAPEAHCPAPDLKARGNNVILAKLEGNNPAGSVKDRPALSMIAMPKQRGDIKPGDTLIEATSGNTGIALAMAAAMGGYRMILVMPENQSIERRQTMRAFGAELVLTPKDGGMELARDVAEKMRDEGRGIILDQFANPITRWRTTKAPARKSGATRKGASRISSAAWDDRHDHGRFALSQGAESGASASSAASPRGLADSRHPQVAGSLSAEDFRSQRGRSRRVRIAGEAER